MFAAKLDCHLVQVFMFVVVSPHLSREQDVCLKVGAPAPNWDSYAAFLRCARARDATFCQRTTQLFSLFLLLLRMICQLYFMFPEDKCDHKPYACAHSQRPAKQQLLWQSTFLVFSLASKLDEAGKWIQEGLFVLWISQASRSWKSQNNYFRIYLAFF